MEVNLDWVTIIDEKFPEVSYKIRPLNTKHFRTLSKYAGRDFKYMSEFLEIVDDVEGILPSYVKDIENLYLNFGTTTKEVEIRHLWEEISLLHFLTAIIINLITISTPSELDLKAFKN